MHESVEIRVFIFIVIIRKSTFCFILLIMQYFLGEYCHISQVHFQVYAILKLSFRHFAFSSREHLVSVLCGFLFYRDCFQQKSKLCVNFLSSWEKQMKSYPLTHQVLFQKQMLNESCKTFKPTIYNNRCISKIV